MRRRIFYLFTISFLVMHVSCAKHETYSERYNFEFRIGDSGSVFWLGDYVNMMLIKPDSLNHNKMVLSQIPIAGQYFRLSGFIYQDIILPGKDIDSLQIVLRCCGSELDNAHLIVSGYNETKKLLRTDTLDIQSEEWENHSVKFSAKDIKLLRLKISVTGIKERAKNQKLQLDKLTIIADTDTLNNSIIPHETPQIDTKAIVKLDGGYDQIPKLKEKRILGIGETAHGTKTFPAEAFRLMKHQIEQNNCKAILVELPIEKLLCWNSYINGATISDSVLNEPFTRVISYSESKELLDWLRTYNQSAERKVVLAGMDINFMQPEIDTKMALSDYLYAYSQQLSDADSRNFLRQISAFDSLPELSKRINTEQVKRLFSLGEYKLLQKSVRLYAKAEAELWLYALRDSCMYENARFVLDSILRPEEKMVIYGHASHINRVTDQGTASLGYCMTQTYQSNYFPVTLLTGGGVFVGNKASGIVETDTLITPPGNSLENAFSSYKYCYYPVEKQIPLTQMRNVGALIMKSQFFPVSASSEMDGMIYIDKCSPAEVFNSGFFRPDSVKLTNYQKIEKYVGRNKRIKAE